MNKSEKADKFTVDWAKIVAKYPEANFAQSPEYGKVNELLGDKVIVEDFGGAGYAQMLVRNARRGRYMEIPCGPLTNWGDESTAAKIIARIGEIGRNEKCVFVRLRPQLLATEENLALLSRLGLKVAPMHLAAQCTVMIDLKQSEADLLAKMRRQTRYEVRRAEKLGINVSHCNTEEIFREFHAVQAETAKRQGFVPPSLRTLLAEREGFGEAAQIYVARTGVGDAGGAKEHIKEGAPVAYGLIISSGKEADYYEAASTDLNRKLPGAYALLWQAICDLKAAGYERFNLWGIAPPGQPHHRYAGVTTFKTGFPGEVVEYVPAHDLVLSRVGYMKDKIVETARKKRRHL